MSIKAVRVDELEVMSQKAPEFTDTWRPYAHRVMITHIKKAIISKGIDIIEVEYSMSSNGCDMFGTYTLGQTTNGKKWQIGIRNSTQKTFAWGIVAGLNIINCSNLMFSGQFIDFRKHTGRLKVKEIQSMANGSVDNIIKEIGKLDTWMENLKTIEMTEDEHKCFVYDMMKNKIFSGSRFGRYISAHEIEKKENRLPTSLYTIHNGVTRIMKGTSLFQNSSATAGLETMCDDYIKIAA